MLICDYKNLPVPSVPTHSPLHIPHRFICLFTYQIPTHLSSLLSRLPFIHWSIHLDTYLPFYLGVYHTPIHIIICLDIHPFMHSPIHLNRRGDTIIQCLLDVTPPSPFPCQLQRLLCENSDPPQTGPGDTEPGTAIKGLISEGTSSCAVVFIYLGIQMANPNGCWLLEVCLAVMRALSERGEELSRYVVFIRIARGLRWISSKEH